MNISHFISTIMKRLRAIAYPDPVRDWLLLVSVALLVLFGIIVWNALTFNTVANGGIIGTPATSTPALFSRPALDAVQQVFIDRAAEEAKYTNGTYSYANPSQ
jgi:hypothetical protein